MSGIPYRHSYEFRVDFFSKVDFDFEEGKANAKLIAAAPDLLEALIDCIEIFDAMNTKAITVDKARAAIAKAKGETYESN